MFDFDAVTPTGARSYCTLKQGAPAASNRWLDSDVPEFKSEWSQLLEGTLDRTLTRPQHKDAIGTIRSLRKKAARGKLRVGDDRTFPARRLNKLAYLLELRPALGTGTPPPRLFRLYYAEPASVADGLLPLVVATKPRDRDVDNEVDGSIDDAKTRSRTWALQRALKEKQR